MSSNTTTTETVISYDSIDPDGIIDDADRAADVIRLADLLSANPDVIATASNPTGRVWVDNRGNTLHDHGVEWCEVWFEVTGDSDAAAEAVERAVAAL